MKTEIRRCVDIIEEIVLSDEIYVKIKFNLNDEKMKGYAFGGCQMSSR